MNICNVIYFFYVTFSCIITTIAAMNDSSACTQEGLALAKQLENLRGTSVASTDDTSPGLRISSPDFAERDKNNSNKSLLIFTSIATDKQDDENFYKDQDLITSLSTSKSFPPIWTATLEEHDIFLNKEEEQEFISVIRLLPTHDCEMLFIHGNYKKKYEHIEQQYINLHTHVKKNNSIKLNDLTILKEGLTEVAQDLQRDYSRTSDMLKKHNQIAHILFEKDSPNLIALNHKNIANAEWQNEIKNSLAPRLQQFYIEINNAIKELSEKNKGEN